MSHSEINLLTPVKVFYVQLALGTWNIYTPLQYAMNHVVARINSGVSFTQVVASLNFARCSFWLVDHPIIQSKTKCKKKVKPISFVEHHFETY